MALVSAAFYFVIGYSRFILGVHALNQVLFGFAFGIWIALAYHFICKKLIFDYVKNTIYHDKMHKACSMTDAAMGLFFTLDLIFIQFCLYYHTKSNEVIPDNVLANVKAKCTNYTPDTHFIKATEEHIWLATLFGFFCFLYVIIVKQFFPHGFGIFPFFMGIAGLCE